MATSRYNRDRLIKGGQMLATASTVKIIRQLLIEGTLKTKSYTAKENERLDHLAAKHLGNAKDWWILAVCSGIGWSLQVPPGTRINIPKNINQIRNITG